MTQEDKLELKFSQMSISELKFLRLNLLWLHDNSILNTSNVLRYIDKSLGIRGEVEKPLQNAKGKKILLLCTSCNNKSIHPIVDNGENPYMQAFRLMTQPCVRCRKVSKYQWKLMEDK